MLTTSRAEALTIGKIKTAHLYKNVALLTGSAIVVFVTLLFATSSLVFLSGLSLSLFPFYITFAVVCYVFFRVSSYIPKPTVAWSFLLFSVTLIGSVLLAGLFFDISWDGQTYHQEGIIQLSNGWNPVFSELKWSDPHIEKTLFLWVNHYPKAAEIAAAAVYQATNSIESGKAINLLLLCASFCLAFAAICEGVNLPVPSILLLTVCAAFNPVVVYQSLSFYVDGQIASALLCFGAASYLFYLRHLRSMGALLVFLGCYVINLKFTGFIYFSIVTVGFIIIALLSHRVSLARQYSKIGLLTALLGLSVVGYHPYITNFLNRGHPLFPLMGSGEKVDLMTTTIDPLGGVAHARPREFGNNSINRVTKLLLSLGSESTPGKTIRAKIPFHVKAGELTAFYNPDVRLGGFGPMFSGILLLFIGLLIYSAVSRQGDRNFYVITLLVFASVLANPEAWWARYVPQLWLMPVIAAMFAIQTTTKIRLAGYLMALLILLNAGLVGAPYFHHQLTSTKLVLAQLKNLEERPLPLKVEFFQFRSNRVRLTEHGIGYLEVTGIGHETSTRLYGSMTRIQSE